MRLFTEKLFLKPFLALDTFLFFLKAHWHLNNKKKNSTNLHLAKEEEETVCV